MNLYFKVPIRRVKLKLWKHGKIPVRIYMQFDFMEIPRYVAMGSKALNLVPDVCIKLGLKGIGYVLSGSTFTRKVAEKVEEEMRNRGFYMASNVVAGNPYSEKMIKSTIETYRDARGKGASFIIGVGGGRVLDVAKLVASWLGIPFVSLPTSTSHDGIASPAISFLLRYMISKHLGRENVKVSAPLAIVADIDVISREPYHMIAAGFGDLVAKYTAVRDWKLARNEINEDYSEYAASMSLMSAKLVVKHLASIKAGSKQGIRVLVKALIGSGVSMSIAGSSRPASGSEHLFSHALDLLSLKYGFKPGSHGIQCGIGTIVAMYLHGGEWMRIRRLLSEISAPVDAYSLGIEPKYLVEALVEACSIRPERYTILSKKKLTLNEAKQILEETEIV